MVSEDPVQEDKQESQAKTAVSAAAEAVISTTAQVTASAAQVTASAVVPASRLFPFKNPGYEHKNIVNGKRKPWRTLKQILAQVGSRRYFGSGGQQTLFWHRWATHVILAQLGKIRYFGTGRQQTLFWHSWAKYVTYFGIKSKI